MGGDWYFTRSIDDELADMYECNERKRSQRRPFRVGAGSIVAACASGAAILYWALIRVVRRTLTHSARLRLRRGGARNSIASYIRPGHWNDPDMLGVGNGGMTNDEYCTHMSLWVLLAAPLLAGNDLRAMSIETKSILMNRGVIAIDQDRVAKPAKVISYHGMAEVVARPLADHAIAVGLFNLGDQPAEIRVDWESLGVAGKRLKVRDLWAHQDVPVTADHYSATVPTHGVALLRVSVVH